MLSKIAATIGHSMGAKSAKQWRFLVTLWCVTGVVALIAPWNLAAGATLFSLFVHLAVTE